ncbi:hypothetical protein PLESTF_001674300 [Pleodorina starrii]|nr:hypothetical protein PLESTM_001547000 [Pleodorina starrii]GLC75691.1 hypothetical protein PLESTF_001674300 [Pleodorina starrii]
MSLHINAASSTGHRLSMTRIQYELGTTLPYDYVSKDAGSAEQPTLVMPKTIKVKATPRFGAVMMATSSSAAAAAAAAGPGPGTINTGDAAAALGPHSAPTAAATVWEVNNRSDGTAAAPSGPPPEVGEGPTSDEDSSDDADDAAALQPEATAAARARHRVELGLASHAAEVNLFLPNRSVSTTNQILPPACLETAALRGRLRRMSATDVPTPLQYTPRPPAPAASIDGGPSSTGSLRAAAAAAAAAAGGTVSCCGAVSRDPWSSSIPGLPAPRGGGAGGDAAARTRVISHLMYSCSDTGPGLVSAWSPFSAPQPDMQQQQQQLEGPGPSPSPRELRPSLTGCEGPASGRGRGLAARAPIARPSTTGTPSSAAGGACGDLGAAADDAMAGPLVSAASLPGSVASVPVSCCGAAHHPPLQRRPHLQLSQLPTGESGLALRPTLPAVCSPPLWSPSPSPSSQPFGTSPYGDGPCSAPPTACGFGANTGTTPAASTEARLLRPPRHLRQPPPPSAAAPAAELPASLAGHGVAALFEAVAPWPPPDSSGQSPRSFGSSHSSHLVAPGSNASFRYGIGGAQAQHSSPLARPQVAPAAAAAAAAAAAGEAATADEARDDDNVNSDVGSNRQLGLGLWAADPGPRSAASDVAGGADMPAGGCKGYGILGSLLPPPPSNEHSSESGEDFSSPFVFPAEAAPPPQTPPPPLQPPGSPAPRPALLLPSVGCGCASGAGGGGACTATQLVLPPTPPAFRRPSVGDDRHTPPPSPPAPACQASRMPAAAMCAGGVAAAAQPPLSPSPHPRGPYTHSTGPAQSSPLPSPQSQCPKQSFSPCPQLLYLLAQQLQQQQQQQQQPRRRAADSTPAAAAAAFAAGEADGALVAASPTASAATSPCAAASPASCPDPGTPTGGGGGRQRFVHLLGSVGAKRHAPDRHQALSHHATATAAGGATLQPRGASGAAPEAPSSPLPSAPSGAAPSPLPPPSSSSSSFSGGGGGGQRGLLPGRPRSRGGGPLAVEISADEHRDIMARMKKALSFLKRGGD